MFGPVRNTRAAILAELRKGTVFFFFFQNPDFDDFFRLD